LTNVGVPEDKVLPLQGRPSIRRHAISAHFFTSFPPPRQMYVTKWQNKSHSAVTLPQTDVSSPFGALRHLRTAPKSINKLIISHQNCN
jgi:hypothetical protein